MNDLTTRCGWCGALVVMSPVDHPRPPTGYVDACDVRGRKVQLPSSWGMFTCPGCRGAALAVVVESEHEMKIVRWYHHNPPAPTYPGSVPASIAAAAREAHRTLESGNLHASVLMAQVVINKSASAKNIPTEASLIEKIDSLYNQHLIYKHVLEAARELRVLRWINESGDMDAPTISEEEARAATVLMDLILDGVFIAPAKASGQSSDASSEGTAAQTSGWRSSV